MSFPCVNVRQVKGKPRCVVLLLGWMGAQEKHLQKYADLYEARGCSTVAATASMACLLGVKFGSERRMKQFAMKAAHETASILRQHSGGQINDEVPPLVVHVFSNAGGLALEQLELQIQQHPNDEDLKLIARRLYDGKQGGCILDSAPAFTTPEAAVNAVKGAVSSPVKRFILSFVYLMLHSIAWLLSCIGFIPNRHCLYWKRMVESQIPRQTFLYSSADDITNVHKLEELIQERRERGVHIVSSKNFYDSNHVQHWKKYQKEYEEAIDLFLSTTDNDK